MRVIASVAEPLLWWWRTPAGVDQGVSGAFGFLVLLFHLIKPRVWLAVAVLQFMQVVHNKPYPAVLHW